MEIGSKISTLSIPIAIVISGALIAGALYLGTQNGSGAALGTQPPDAPSGNLEEMAAISKDDHIRGNTDSPVKIVEYSDFECPFCKRFHETMSQVMDEYGAQGKVAWVYRHFPLDALHPIKARKEAVAAECAGELGGNDAFWKYADRFFELTPSNNQTDIDTVLPQIAKEIGLNTKSFNTCLTSGKYDAHIDENSKNSVATGGNGTPWSIIVSSSGKKYPLSGAQPYESIKQLIEIALTE